MLPFCVDVPCIDRIAGDDRYAAIWDVEGITCRSDIAAWLVRVSRPRIERVVLDYGHRGAALDVVPDDHPAEFVADRGQRVVAATDIDPMGPELVLPLPLFIKTLLVSTTSSGKFTSVRIPVWFQ